MPNEPTVSLDAAMIETAIEPTLSLRDITKHYAAIAALTDVSFDVLPGEVHALLGENGAGKSTLMNVASGATTPDSGTISLAGAPVEHLTPAIAQGPGHRDRPPASCAPARHDGRREHPRGRRARASAAPRSGRPQGDALIARRRPLRGPSRGSRLVAQRLPPPPARARQGVRRLAAAPDPRRADRAAVARLRRAPLHCRSQAGRGGNRHRLYHPPTGRGTRDRRPRHRPARRQVPWDVGRVRDLGREPPRHDHRPHARGHVPAQARAGGRRGAAAAGRRAERRRLRQHLVQRTQGRDRGHRRRRRQRSAGAPSRPLRAPIGERLGQRRRQGSLAAGAAPELGLHAGRPPRRGPDDRAERARERRADRARLAQVGALHQPPPRDRGGRARALRVGRQGAIARGAGLGALGREPAEGRDGARDDLQAGHPRRRRADPGRRRWRARRDLPHPPRGERRRRAGRPRLERRPGARRACAIA